MNLGSHPENKVFVWGLNDKDQLGGLKGSKIKFPAYSETLSALKPIHIAGGSKSLFIVSNNGKVSYIQVLMVALIERRHKKLMLIYYYASKLTRFTLAVKQQMVV